MNKDFILPDIGEGIVECEVIEWKVKEGDLIEEDQIVVDVSTDKAIVEIPSMYNGRVTKLYYQESDTAQVHKPLFAIEVEAEGQGEGQIESQAKSQAESQAQDNKQTTPAAIIPAQEPEIAAMPSSDKVLTTPAVRKMAREHSIDLATIPRHWQTGSSAKRGCAGLPESKSWQAIA